MKKLVILLTLLFILVGTSVIFYTLSHTAPDLKEVTTTVPVEQTPATPDTSISKPTRLRIPKLGIDTDIEYVGMDEKGNMDVPKKDENVAWFEPGYLPGSNGSAVLAGHYDRKNGDPAVFYEVQSLKVGDEIEVVMENNQTLSFAVTKQETYATDDFPLTEVFGSSSEPRLNLITCEGDYDQQQRSYSHRTVVYTTVVR